MVSSNKDNESDTDFNDPKTDQESDFIEGEKVLAYHGLCIYKAKVQKVELSRKDGKYYVHYLGWNKSWDEWVEMGRLLKFTEENIEKQEALNKQEAHNKKQGRDKNLKSRGRSTQSKPKSSTEARADKEDLKNYVGRNKKRKVESGMEEKDTVSTNKHVKVQIPSNLKKQLLDDCEYVTQLSKLIILTRTVYLRLVKLPRAPCVDDIMKKYLDHKSKKDAIIGESVGEVLKGLRSYFDKALPIMLLYKKEFQQYREAIANNTSPSTVYGAEHLLRLFVKLPEILTFANIDEETTTQLLQNLQDFLKFLQKSRSTFFLSTYDVPQDIEANSMEDDD